MTMLIASGYVVALVLGVLYVGAQVRGWNEDAMVIGAFARSFNGTARSLRTFLTTEDFAWANESVWWLAIASDLADDAHRRGGFPSGTALGLTWLSLTCGLFGLQEFFRGLEGNPTVSPETKGEVELFARLYDSLWSDLRSVQPSGTDPLGQLGPERIQSVKDSMGEIRTLSSRWEGGPGSICSFA